MLENLRKKDVKKWKKIKAKLINQGVEVVDEKSCCIAVANAGLGNGVNIEQINEILQSFGEVDYIESCHEKSYVLASYHTIDAADMCVTSLQGHTLKKSSEDHQSSILYLYFIQNISCSYNETIPQDLPRGLHKFDEFLSEQEEKELLMQIERCICSPSDQHVQERLKQRTVLHYGYKFRYGTNDVDSMKPICKDGLPHFIEQLLDKMMMTGHIPTRPDQLTINKYQPGDGIPPHIDGVDAFDCTISTVSLNSQTVMEMKQPCLPKIQILLKPRTLLIFTGDSRYKWTHGITARKTDLIIDEISDTPVITKRGTRISLTFRKVVPNNPSPVDIIDYNKIKLPTDRAEAAKLENNLVHDVYDNIADHFSSTRGKPWPGVVKFLKDLQPGSTVLDVGCGSGRYLNSSPDIFILGCDRSSLLIDICHEKHPHVFVCDGLNIPVRDSCFDACICIAVIHHYSTYQRRRSAIHELLRATRQGGFILIYVWAVEQRFKNIDSNYLKQKRENTDDGNSNVKSSEESKIFEDLSLVVHTNRTEFVQQDVLVPWKTRTEKLNQDSTYYRFYHVFKQDELVNLCKSIPNCKVIESNYDNGNWCVNLQKV